MEGTQRITLFSATQTSVVAFPGFGTLHPNFQRWRKVEKVDDSRESQISLPPPSVSNNFQFQFYICYFSDLKINLQENGKEQHIIHIRDFSACICSILDASLQIKNYKIFPMDGCECVS